MATPTGLQDPNFEPLWMTGGTIPAFTSLSPAELALFERTLNHATRIYDKQGQDVLSAIFRAKHDDYLYAASVMKQAFNNLEFGGDTTPAGFNMQEIMAVTLLSQAASPLIYSWAKNITSTGWQAFFGSSSSKLTLGTSGTSTSPGVTYKRVGFLATHLYSTIKPKYDAIQVGVKSNTYPVYSTRFSLLGDIYVAELQAPLLVTPDDSFFIMQNAQRIGQDDTALGGFQFVTSQYAILQ